MANIEDKSFNDLREDFENQIAALRKQVEGIRDSLADRGFELLDDAEEMAGNMAEQAGGAARRAAKHVQHEVSAVAEVARDNPAVTTTVLATVGLVGMAIGYILGSTAQETSRHRYW